MPTTVMYDRYRHHGGVCINNTLHYCLVFFLILKCPKEQDLNFLEIIHRIGQYKYVVMENLNQKLKRSDPTHGQLYVGLSRVGSADNQFILLPQNKTTSNIV